MKKNYVWILFVLLCLCAIPSLWHKVQTERSVNQVEFSIDYLSLLSLSEQSSKPERFLHAMLSALKEEGVTTLTLPNNTFQSLEERGLVSVLSSDELAAIQLFADKRIPIDRNLTYVLFLDQTMEKELLDMMQTRFPHHHMEKISLNGQTMTGIDVPMEKLLNLSIPYLTDDLTFLTQKMYNFSLVLKLDNKWEGNEDVALAQLHSLAPEKIASIYFADSGVLGYPNDHAMLMKALPDVPFAYKEYFTAEEKQKGIDALAKERDYNMVRLHVIPQALFIDHLQERNVLVERMTKAVTERNIRLFHVQLPWVMDERTGKNIFTASLSILKETKEALQQKGYTFGASEPFPQSDSHLLIWSKWCALLAGILLIVFTVHAFLPKWTGLASFLLIGLALTSGIVTPLPEQILAFLTAICVPFLVAKWALHKKMVNDSTSIWRSIGLFMGMSLLSVGGGLLLASMHSETKHLLYVETFRGVSLAHLIPPVLVFCFLLKWHDLLHKDALATVALAPVRIYQVAVVGILGVVAMYYVSRTGNSGILLPFETEFRTLLENVFGVRPRTKEFLLAHPLMFVILYYWHRHKWVKWGLPIAIVGQLSMVNTFTHFHTPVLLSFERSMYGVGLGLCIGLFLIALIEGGKWLWKKKLLHGDSEEKEE